MPRETIFPECPIFLDGIGQLNQCRADYLEKAFTFICLGAEGRGRTEMELEGEELMLIKELEGEELMLTTLRTILDNVAFHPVRPEDMQVELDKVGLSGDLSARLAATWAKHARQVVNDRKKVNSNLRGVDYELLTDVQTAEERVKLSLLLNSNNSNFNSSSISAEQLSLSFSPDQLFKLFESLESVQKKLDQICS